MSPESQSRLTRSRSALSREEAVAEALEEDGQADERTMVK
jgi:hypothetical protein